MEESQPDIDVLSSQITINKYENVQGKLKVFFGYAAGVGKTFSMLQAANDAKHSGIDVVVGYIEPHTRPQTNKLIEKLEVIPPLETHHKGIVINEFDLDQAIKRHPQLILVDELAHTNIKGCRNLKRYQDIQELLKAGIDVYTTVNVQHIESLNDIVASITGITVRERIPDKVLDDADQIELVDIEPDELIVRLNQGKIYKSSQAKRALHNFFIKENLVALREVALRRIADQINKKVEKNKSPTQKAEYYTNDHILICLSSSPSNAKVIRAAARIAGAFHSKFTALFVEVPGTEELSDENRARLRSNLKIAEQLGAKIATVLGYNVPEQIAEYAKVSGISKIILGQSNNKRGIIPHKSFVEKLTELSPNLDIYIIPDNVPPYTNKISKARRKKNSKNNSKSNAVITLADTIKSLLILALITLLCFWFFGLGFSEANIITVYILGVLFTSICTNGKVYSLGSSLVSVLVFNFFFTSPRFSLEAYDASYPATFIIMFIAAFLTSTLTTRIKEQAHQNAIKARSTEVLLETSQKLQRAENREQIYSAMGRQMQKLLNRTVMIYPISNDNKLIEPLVFPKNQNTQYDIYITSDERAVAEWVLKNNKNAGATTNTLPGSKCLNMAVRGHDTVYSVVAVAMDDINSLDAYEKTLFISMLGEFGLVLEKERINEIKNEIYVQAQREQLRANLLRAISHDLRTPLTSISGNASILMGNSNVLDEYKKMQLYTDIYDDSMWLINLVENLLSVTRIENGNMALNMHSEIIEEVINEALHHINRKSIEYNIRVSLSDDLLMAKMDSRLIVQVIINIVDNAIKYTNPGSSIVISAKKINEQILVSISDNGEGISDDDKKKLFDMFFTADKNIGDSRRGLGLGLCLCKSIINAHGGDISVKDNIPHGTVFSFTLQAKEVIFYE
ncbi:MAG: sensor histidine kinase KdpD [Oscillospiraceae bacterium]